ncbi:MAG: histidine kinase [Desulfobacterales bacterium]|nr:histidine kinase [Desulfobacterales bacterium]
MNGSTACICKRFRARAWKHWKQTGGTVARELHDSIGGSLAAIKFGLEEAAGRAGQESGLARSALLGTLVSHTWRTPSRRPSASRPTCARCRWTTWGFGHHRVVHPTVQSAVRQHPAGPPDRRARSMRSLRNYKIVFYRVLQEAVNNALKHSQADAVISVLESVRLISNWKWRTMDPGSI